MKKLSLYQSNILSEIKDSRLHVEFTGDKKAPLHYYLPGGKTISVATVEVFKRNHLIVAVGDSMLGGIPQTYEAS